jgi:predicted Rossmann fold flavoprotein
VSDDGRDIVGVFEDVFAKYRDNITLHYGEWTTDVSVIPVNTGIQTSSIDPGTSLGWQKQSMYQLTTPKWTYTSDILVITTGWNAYSQTGSTGDGYAFARALGHSVTQLGPSLSSFLTKESWMHALSWVALEDARIGNLRWPILLTHFGLSGPLAFMLSSRLAWEEISPTSGTHITLAPRADIDTDMWDIFFRESFALHPKKLITSILSEKLTRRFAESIIDTYFAHIRETFVGSIGKWDRLGLAKLLWDGINITLLERRPWDEFVTAGGVDTSELDPDTMQSRIQKHLYFAGEVLNVDGYTGGFSLQICWSSGYVAGLDIAKNL